MLFAPSVSIGTAALPALAGAASSTETYASILDQLRSDSTVNQYVALHTLEVCAPSHPLAIQAADFPRILDDFLEATFPPKGR